MPPGEQQALKDQDSKSARATVDQLSLPVSAFLWRVCTISSCISGSLHLLFILTFVPSGSTVGKMSVQNPNSFINPPSPYNWRNDYSLLPSYEAGQVMELSWTTTFDVVDMVLYQPGVQDASMYIFYNKSGITDYSWTIDTRQLGTGSLTNTITGDPAATSTRGYNDGNSWPLDVFLIDIFRHNPSPSSSQTASSTSPSPSQFTSFASSYFRITNLSLLANSSITGSALPSVFTTYVTADIPATATQTLGPSEGYASPPGHSIAVPLALGLGIPAILSIIGLIIWCVVRRKKRAAGGNVAWEAQDSRRTPAAVAAYAQVQQQQQRQQGQGGGGGPGATGDGMPLQTFSKAAGIGNGEAIGTGASAGAGTGKPVLFGAFENPTSSTARRRAASLNSNLSGDSSSDDGLGETGPGRTNASAGGVAGASGAARGAEATAGQEAEGAGPGRHLPVEHYAPESQKAREHFAPSADK